MKLNFLILLYSLLFTPLSLFAEEKKTKINRIFHSYNSFIPDPKGRNKQISLSLKTLSAYFKMSFTENIELGADLVGLFTLRPNIYLKYKLFEETNLSFLFQGFFSSKEFSSLRPRIVTNKPELPFKNIIFLRENADYSLRFTPKLIYSYMAFPSLALNISFSDNITFEKWTRGNINTQDENPFGITSFEAHDFSLTGSVDYFVLPNFVIKPLAKASLLLLDVENLGSTDLIQRELSYGLQLSFIYITQGSSELEIGGAYSPAPFFSPIYAKFFYLEKRRKMIPTLLMKYTWRLH